MTTYTVTVTTAQENLPELLELLTALDAQSIYVHPTSTPARKTPARSTSAVPSHTRPISSSLNILHRIAALCADDSVPRKDLVETLAGTSALTASTIQNYISDLARNGYLLQGRNDASQNVIALSAKGSDALSSQE